jgi:ketol-acid reductoisomerase
VVGGKEQLKKRLRKVLETIRSGEFASDWVKECGAGMPNFKSQRRRLSESQIEEVGEKLRDMMPWLAEHRLVDQQKN